MNMVILFMKIWKIIKRKFLNKLCDIIKKFPERIEEKIGTDWGADDKMM